MLEEFPSLHSLHHTGGRDASTTVAGKLFHSHYGVHAASKHHELEKECHDDVGDHLEARRAHQHANFDAAIAHLESMQDSNIFPCLETRSPGQGLSSCAPNRLRETSCQSFRFTNAGLSVNNLPYMMNQRIPEVKGKILARVEEVIPFSSPTTAISTSDDIQEAFRNMFPPHLAKSILAGDRALLRSVCDTLCGGCFSDRIKTFPGRWFSRQESEAMLYGLIVHCFGAAREAFSHDIESPLDVIAHHCTGRAFVVTAEGTTALAPADTHHGDLVAVLVGCSTAVVLRPAPGGRLSAVGPAYVADYMDGEAFLGPLPSCIEKTYDFVEESSSWVARYEYKGSNLALVSDPRLGPLPRAWQRIGNPQDPDALPPTFVNIETGEEREADKDPRLDFAVLKVRLVDLQDFELI